jgi:hypothetical protein
MSVEVWTFSCVEELVAVTVAPGMGVFPDFTIPPIEKVAVGEISCANEKDTTSKSRVRCHAATIKFLKMLGIRTFRLGSEDTVMPDFSNKMQNP